jgi:hypothetical protein
MDNRRAGFEVDGKCKCAEVVVIDHFSHDLLRRDRESLRFAALFAKDKGKSAEGARSRQLSELADFIAAV